MGELDILAEASGWTSQAPRQEKSLRRNMQHRFGQLGTLMGGLDHTRFISSKTFILSGLSSVAIVSISMQALSCISAAANDNNR